MATVALPRSRAAPAADRRAGSAILRRALSDSRTRTVAFAFLFAAVAYIQPVAYRHSYPTRASRLGFAHSFAHNDAVVLFYGRARDLLSVGGYSAWRVGGTLAIFAAVWGLLAAVRALRAEEDAGRTELVLAGIAGRRTAYLAAMAAIAAGALTLWLAELAGLLLGGLPAGQSAFLALATVSVVPVFVGVGALASQLAATRRTAMELGGALVGVALVLRVIADTSGTLGWLSWATPLGWAEQLRPFTGARPAVLLAPVAVGGLLIAAAGAIAARRDVDSGLLAARDSARPHLRLLSSPIGHALRGEWVGLLVWSASVGAFAFIVGLISKSVGSVGISRQLRHELAKLGTGTVLTPATYIGLSFMFFVLVLSLFAVSQVAAARHEEAEERLEILLALPLGRARWLTGRLVLATAATVAISLATGLLAWAGAVTAGARLSLPQMLETGANLLPAALLFLGIAALVFALLPRAGSGIAYGLVAVAFLWQLFGAMLGAPSWLAHATPFAHVGLVPAQPFRAGAAAVMVASGLLAALLALVRFRRRDLTGT